MANSDSVAVHTSAATAATATRERLSTNPPSARGSVSRRAGGLLTRGSLPRRLPSRGQWHIWRGSVSPHSGGTVPDSHRVPLPLAVFRPSLSSRRGGVARAPALGARRRLGGRELRALVDPEPLDRPRRLGHGAAEVRPRGRVRDPRRAALPSARDGRAFVAGRSRLRGNGRGPP